MRSEWRCSAGGLKSEGRGEKEEWGRIRSIQGRGKQKMRGRKRGERNEEWSHRDSCTSRKEVETARAGPDPERPGSRSSSGLCSSWAPVSRRPPLSPAVCSRLHGPLLPPGEPADQSHSPIGRTDNRGQILPSQPPYSIISITVP